MPQELQSILLEDLNIEWPGVHIRRLALNQHMPRVEKLSEHQHPFSQILLYLRGSGMQQIQEREIPVERGSLLAIGAGESHSFAKARQLRPVCLALDLDIKEHAAWRSPSLLNRRELLQVERWLFELSQYPHEEGHIPIPGASLILQILQLLCSKLEADRQSPGTGPLAARIGILISEKGAADLSPSQVAGELGQSLDHLNRLLREEESPTVGQLIQHARLQKCQDLLLRTSYSISEIGSRVGMDDQNYFARWFRRQTGQSPSRWREVMNVQEA